MQATQTPVLPAVLQSVFIKIQDSSMFPQLKPEATVTAEPLPPENWHAQKNKVCAVALKKSLVVARIKKNKLKEKRRLTLYFDNPEFKPFTVSGRDILGMWQVNSIASQEIV